MGAIAATRTAWAWGQRYLPEDRTSRYLTLAVLGSLLAHVLIGMSILFTGWLSNPVIAHRGDLLFIDTAPDTTEKAQPGPTAPAQPPAPDSAADDKPRPAPRALPRPQPSSPEPRAASSVPAPRVADAPPSRPPDPPREIAKAVPSPRAAGEEPAYEGRSAQAPSASPSAKSPAEAAPPPAAAAPPSEPRVASVPPAPATPGATPGQSRGGGGGTFQGSQGGVVGQPVPLDTPDPNYREYMQRVRQQIYAKWVYPREAQDRELRGRLVIEFHIGKDGRLLSLDLITSSGEYVLDSSALNAIKLAERYPPLPDAMQRDVLPIVAIFSYRIHTTQSSTFQLLQ